jgi:hypothetical protein
MLKRIDKQLKKRKSFFTDLEEPDQLIVMKGSWQVILFYCPGTECSLVSHSVANYSARCKIHIGFAAAGERGDYHCAKMPTSLSQLGIQCSVHVADHLPKFRLACEVKTIRVV